MPQSAFESPGRAEFRQRYRPLVDACRPPLLASDAKWQHNYVVHMLIAIFDKMKGAWDPANEEKVRI